MKVIYKANIQFKMIQSKKYLTGKNILIGVLVLFLIFSLIGGSYGYKFFKDKTQKEIDKKEIEIQDSKRKQDSILNLVNEYKKDADFYQGQVENLTYKNHKLNNEIKRKEKDLAIRDTSFIRNARTITESVRGFYPKENDPR